MSKGVEPGQSLFNKHLIGDAYLFRDVTEEKEESLPSVRLGDFITVYFRNGKLKPT